jgi:hypothetical protein
MLNITPKISTKILPVSPSPLHVLTPKPGYLGQLWFQSEIEEQSHTDTGWTEQPAGKGEPPWQRILGERTSRKATKETRCCSL